MTVVTGQGTVTVSRDVERVFLTATLGETVVTTVMDGQTAVDVADRLLLAVIGSDDPMLDMIRRAVAASAWGRDRADLARIEALAAAHRP